MTDERVTGKVVARREGRVRVLLPLKDDCSACGRCGLNAGGKGIEIWARGRDGIRTGDEVEVLIPREDRLRAALLLFGLPLAALLGGAAAGAALGYYFGIGGDTAAILGAVAGAGGGFGLVKFLEKRRCLGPAPGIRVAAKQEDP